MNACNKCDLVKYCNVACKKKHRLKHKKKCDRRAVEIRAALHEEALFNTQPPPNEDCPICMLPLPDGIGGAINASQTNFKSCCGKVICHGCMYAMEEEKKKGGEKCSCSKDGCKNFCPFCRVHMARSYEEDIDRIKKLMERDNAEAFATLGGLYAQGSHGLRQNWARANELLLKAGELGCGSAYSSLANAYHSGRGVEVDKEKAKYYFELAAMKGNANARYNLGAVECQAGNHDRGMKHFIIAARAGNEYALETVKDGYMDGLVTKDEYACVLREYQMRQDEVKSDQRDKAAAARAEGRWVP